MQTVLSAILYTDVPGSQMPWKMYVKDNTRLHHHLQIGCRRGGMSVFKAKEYFILLLTTPSRTQKIALLDTCTNNQIEGFGDIARNLLRLPLSPQARVAVAKRKSFLNKLSVSTISSQEKARLISKHYRLILDILRTVKNPLLKLLTEV